MKRKRRSHQDEEPTAVNVPQRDTTTAEEATADTESQGPLAPATLQRLQRQYGNSYVQRYVTQEKAKMGMEQPMVQRQEQGDDQQKREPLAPEPFEFKGQARLLANGELEIDLRPVLNTRNMNIDPAVLPQKLRRWFGMGLLALGERAETLAYELKVTSEGRVKFPLGQDLLATMLNLTDNKEQGKPLDYRAPFGTNGFDIEANLYFSSAPLMQMDMDGTDKFFDSDQAKNGQIFLMLSLQALFPPEKAGGDEQEEVQGVLLFVNE